MATKIWIFAYLLLQCNIILGTQSNPDCAPGFVACLANIGGLYRFDFDPHATSIFPVEFNSPLDLQYVTSDLKSGDVFFTSVSPGKLYRYNFKIKMETQVVADVDTDLAIVGMTIDPERQNIVYVDYMNSIMGTLSFDGHMRGVLLDNLDRPHAVILDKQKNEVYYSEYGKISKYNILSGSSELVVTITGKTISGLTADFVENALYWCEDNGGIIGTVYTNGSNPRTLNSSHADYKDITLLGEYLYFTEQSEGNIFELRKDGSDLTKLLMLPMNQPHGIAAICMPRDGTITTNGSGFPNTTTSTVVAASENGELPVEVTQPIINADSSEEADSPKEADTVEPPIEDSTEVNDTGNKGEPVGQQQNGGGSNGDQLVIIGASCATVVIVVLIVTIGLYCCIKKRRPAPANGLDTTYIKPVPSNKDNNNNKEAERPTNYYQPDSMPRHLAPARPDIIGNPTYEGQGQNGDQGHYGSQYLTLDKVVNIEDPEPVYSGVYESINDGANNGEGMATYETAQSV